MDESNLFIASSIISLLDLLKTEIARNKVIHCQFAYCYFEEDKLLLQQCKEKGVTKLSFTNGKGINLETLEINDGRY